MESFIPVKGIIGVKSRHQILGIHRTTEEFKTVIVRGKRLNVFYNRSGTNATHGKTLDFVTGYVPYVNTGVTDRYVADNTRVIVYIVPTITGIRFRVGDFVYAFDEFSAIFGRVVGGRIT